MLPGLFFSSSLLPFELRLYFTSPDSLRSNSKFLEGSTTSCSESKHYPTPMLCKELNYFLRPLAAYLPPPTSQNFHAPPLG